MDPYVGQIIMWAGGRIPQNWHLCDGSILKRADYETLFSLIGTIYGGDGINNFALPDLRGRVVVGQGVGPSLTPRVLGQKGGAEQVALSIGQMPTHTHGITATSVEGTSSSPVNHVWASNAKTKLYSSDVGNEQLSDNGIGVSGFGIGHENMMPSQAINFIISLQGIYPMRP